MAISALPELPARFALRLALGFIGYYTAFFLLLGTSTYFTTLAALFSAELCLVVPYLRDIRFSYVDTGPHEFDLHYHVEFLRTKQSPEGPVAGVLVKEGNIRGVIMFLNPACLFSLILSWPGIPWKRRFTGISVGTVLLLAVFSLFVGLNVVNGAIAEDEAAGIALHALFSLLDSGGVTILILLADAAAFLVCFLGARQNDSEKTAITA